MTKSFDLQSIIWLINSEIRSAVTAIQFESGVMEIQQVRVRMGQDMQTATAEVEGSISLSIDRYPLAERGWLVDVAYDPSAIGEHTIVSKKEYEQTEDSAPVSWRGVSPDISVRYLEGVGSQRHTMLKKFGLNSLAELVAFDKSGPTGAQKLMIRRFKTLANLALQAPPIALHSDLLKHNVMDLINQPNILSKAQLSKEGEAAIYQWLLTLEICFNDNWLRRTPLNKMIDLGRVIN
jgi:hypothetical protein